MPVVNASDDAGSIAFTTSSDAVGDPTNVGLGPAWRRFLTTGVYNSDWASTPPFLDAMLDNTNNPLPYWTVGGSAYATTIIPYVTVSTFTASGFGLRFAMSTTCVLNDEAYVEQIVPVPASRDRSGAWFPRAYFKGVSGAGNFNPFVNGQYLKADGVTTTGSLFEATETTFDQTVSTGGIGVSATADPATVAPADAAFLRVRVGVRCIASPGGNDTVAEVTEVQMDWARTIIGFADDLIPTNAPATLRQTSSIFQLQLGSTTFQISPVGHIQWTAEVQNTAFTITNGGTATFSNKDLRWQRIGAFVMFHLAFSVTAAGSGASNVGITSTGLPPAVNNLTYRQMGDRSGTGPTAVAFRFTVGSSELQLNAMTNLSGFTNITGADLANGATYQVDGIYHA